MTMSLDRLMASLKAEVKCSVSPYFAPVRAVVRDVSEAVYAHPNEKPSTHAHEKREDSIRRGSD